MENFRELSIHTKTGESLYNNSYMSDIKFQVGEDIMYAHKNFLSCKSEIFYTMFYGNAKFEDSCVRVEDLSKKAFEIILKNIYTGEIDFKGMDSKLLLEILYGAEKYMLKDLISKCAEEINISNENAVPFPISRDDVTQPQIIETDDSFRALKSYLASSIHSEMDIEDYLVVNVD
ncbi:unnamed protein product [Gordionus sp. m RMFG-2023]